MGPPLERTQQSKVVMIAGLVTALIAIVWLASGSVTVAPAPTSQTAPLSSASSTEASNEFKDVMHMARQAGLVSSYEFSDSERVIYVTELWFAMTVSFKKDFLARVALLQEAISGRQYFEVRNDRSNEKVGEVTAFGGSLEVYR